MVASKIDNAAAGVLAAFHLSQPGADMSSTELQHAWFELTRARPWRSVALVPIEEGGQALVLAHQLAALAAQDPRQRVLVINATGVVDNTPKGPPAAAGGPFADTGVTPMAGGRYGLLDCAKLGFDDSAIGMVEVPKHSDALRQDKSPFTLMLVATPSLLLRPQAVSTARSVDTVVLCVGLGRTDFASARRTVELVGEENIAGSLALRPH